MRRTVLHIMLQCVHISDSSLGFLLLVVLQSNTVEEPKLLTVSWDANLWNSLIIVVTVHQCLCRDRWEVKVYHMILDQTVPHNPSKFLHLVKNPAGRRKRFL